MEHQFGDHYGLAMQQSLPELEEMKFAPLSEVDEDLAVEVIERYCLAAFLHHIKHGDGEVQLAFERSREKHSSSREGAPVSSVSLTLRYRMMSE